LFETPAGRELASGKAGVQDGSGGSGEKPSAGGADDTGTGRFLANAGAGRGTGDQRGGSISGVSPGAVNLEDVGTGSAAGADSDKPLRGRGAGAGAESGNGGAGGKTGLAGSANRLGGGNSGADSVFQVPNFEPAGDQAEGSPTIGQPGLLSGQVSRGGTGTGVRAPTFGLGERINRPTGPGNDDGSGGIGGTLLPPKGAAPAGAGEPDSTAADSLGGPATGEAAGAAEPGAERGSGARTTGMSGGAESRGRGFDWAEAAKDGPPKTNPGGAGADQAADNLAFGGDTGPRTSADAARANVTPGGALNRSSTSVNVPQGLQADALPPGQYSQEDIDRAKSLSGLSSLVSPDLAAKLSGLASAAGALPGMPSSTSSNNTSSNAQASGGMPLGGNTQPSLSASSPGSFGLNSSSSSDEANDLIMPPRPKEALPTGAIEARFEIVVVCRKDEVVLHPGTYRLTGDVLRSPGQGTDFLLAREIRAMVRNRAIVDPMIRQKPAIRFLVESQGAEMFALARRQLLFSLPDWPVSLQVSGLQDQGIFSRNPW
jgi:hypothetical protein